MKIKSYHALTGIIALAMAASCSATKYLAEDEKLYDKGTVVIHQDSIPEARRESFESHLEDMLRPEPNAKILGMRWKVGLYNMGGGPDTSSGAIGRWLKRQGEEPVLLSDVNREYNENLLRNRMENLGFFNAYVTSDTLINDKLAEVVYDAFPGTMYRISNVDFEVDSTKQLGRDIIETKPGSLLQVGRGYNLDVVLDERERIDNILKNKGYYYFSADHLLLEVDSSSGNYDVDMYLKVKPETPERARQPQKIGNVYIYPNYRQTSEGLPLDRPRRAELFDDRYYFIDPANTYRRPVLANHIFFEPGRTYNRVHHNRTISHLVNLNAFKFVKNTFVDSPDSANTMDVYYHLTPMERKSLRFEVLGKTAAVYNGTEANVNWTLRNAFKGFETLTVSVFGGYETQTGGSVNLNSNFLRYGAEVGITWPRLLSPYKWAPAERFIPRTYARVGYEFLNRRNAFTLNSLSLNYGYNWKENDRKEHDLAAAEIIYVQPRNISADYRAQMDTVPTLRHIVDPQFSFGPNYTFTYTNSMETWRTHTFYAKTGANTSGNVLGLIQGANYEEGAREIFGTPYAQFVKAEADFRHYMRITANSQLASRIMVGASHSYGNSRSLPYLKQFFSGGPNGLRAYRARAVGPGSAIPQNVGENNFFADQTGDFKLELNTEYRARIAGMLHWAAFVDAGNIWLQRANDEMPGGQLSSDFYKELAVGAGLGIRLDIDFFVIRTDFAIPVRVPYREPNDRWVFKYIDFGDSQWRRNNLVFNLAIGYPF